MFAEVVSTGMLWTLVFVDKHMKTQLGAHVHGTPNLTVLRKHPKVHVTPNLTVLAKQKKCT